MRIKLSISLGIILFLITSVGCQNYSLNTSNSLSKAEGTTVVEPAEEASENTNTNCSTVNPHPIAEGMTGTFEITYDEVMTMYCDGYAFSDILLALETAELVDQSPEALLARLRTRTWQEIWDEIGVSPE